VLAYAYDVSAGAKHEAAVALMARLWARGGGLLSVQVLQELFVTLTNRAKIAMDHSLARSVIANLSVWNVYTPAPEDVLVAIDGAAEWQVSFWDSLILTAARSSGASLVWSEDLSHGRSYGGLPVQNPFGV
jgi:predicted nucleic acid-binding protein